MEKAKLQFTCTEGTILNCRSRNEAFLGKCLMTSEDNQAIYDAALLRYQDASIAKLRQASSQVKGQYYGAINPSERDYCLCQED